MMVGTHKQDTVQGLELAVRRNTQVNLLHPLEVHILYSPVLVPLWPHGCQPTLSCLRNFPFGEGLTKVLGLIHPRGHGVCANTPY